MNPLPDLGVLRERFRLDAQCGTLYWRRSGKPALSERGRGYLHARLDGRLLYVHRIVFALANGHDPYPLQVDHIDGNPRNNRPENLRLATNAQNVGHRTRLNSNNKSGCAGVYWHKGAGKWAACAKRDGKTVHLGLFTDTESAAQARKGI